jgi:DNA-binding CsgD family transcriptional regulator
MKDTTMTLKRATVTLVIIAVLLTLLPACSARDAPITVPVEGQAEDLVGLEPCTYEANEVEYDAHCGTLVVPENRADPNSRLITLPVIRVRATGDDPAEPIFAGGPGTPNLHFGHLEDVVGNHDFVLVGYRGVDGSVVLDCPEISDAIRNARGLLSDSTLERYTAAGASCARRLQAEGVDLAGYTLAEPSGFFRAFVDEGPPMAHLLYEALSRGIVPDYIRQLLGAFPDVELEQAGQPSAQAPEPDLIEPLSEREIEALQLIAEGLTNSEIASRLFLSLNTIKVHARNIYGKLGVHSRTRAVARAQALGLLPDKSI